MGRRRKRRRMGKGCRRKLGNLARGSGSGERRRNNNRRKSRRRKKRM